MILNNITFADMLKLTDEEAFIYSYSFKYGRFLNKAKNHFKFKPLREYTFGQIKDVQQEIEKGLQVSDIPRVLALFEGDDLRYFNETIVEVFQQFAWVKESVIDITEIEREALSRQLTDKEIKAGVDRFEMFGVYPQIRSFANAFNQTIDWARSQPYEHGFVELIYQKTLGEYESNYSKIK